MESNNETILLREKEIEPTYTVLENALGKELFIIYQDKKGVEFCHQCKSYPCSRYRKFADRWQKYGQDLLENQEFIKTNGKEDFVRKMNKNARIAPQAFLRNKFVQAVARLTAANIA